MADGFVEPDDKILVSASTMAAYMPQEDYEMGKVVNMLRYLASTDRSGVRMADTLLKAVDKGETFGVSQRIYENRFGVENEDGLTPASLGTHVHGVLEDIMTKGTVDPRKLSQNPHDTTKDHVRQLVDWYETCQPEMVMSEQVLYNWEMGWAGTVDLICHLTIKNKQHKFVVLDLKTTAKKPTAFYGTKYGIQLGTYWSASHAWTIESHMPRTYAKYGRTYLIKEEEHERNTPLFQPFNDMAVILTVWPEGWQMRGMHMPMVAPFMSAALASYWYHADTQSTRNPYTTSILAKGSAE